MWRTAEFSEVRTEREREGSRHREREREGVNHGQKKRDVERGGPIE